MQKLTFFIISSVTALLLYFGLDSISSISEEDSAENAGELLEYDAVSDGINSVLYDASGSISYTLQARRQYHFKDQTSELQEPFIRLFRDGKSHWNIVAERGYLAPQNGDSNLQEGTIELSGDVEIYSLDDFGNRTVLSTEFLTIDPANETMQTDQAVAMHTPNIQQRAIGMFAQLDSDEILFIRNGEGRYEIRPIP
jgi:LPS export ABC transporter protein LptC